MSSSASPIMENLLEKLMQEMNNSMKEEEEWRKLHTSIIVGYLSNLLPNPSAQLLLTHHQPWKVDSFKKELKEMFVVNNLHQNQNRIDKCRLVESFLSLLLQLLYLKTDSIVDPFQDRIENLERELRYVLTILGDVSWMLLHDDAEFQNLLPDFEEVADQAGSFVHYLFFSDDQTYEETNEGIDAVLKKTDLLKANLESCVSIASYTTPPTSVIDSILILHSVVDDVEELLKREDDPIADVKDPLTLLHHELLLSHSSINDMRSPQPSEIEELKDPLMRVGGIAHQAEYLITSILVKDAPLWYVFNRLTHLSHMIQPLRKELQQATLKYQIGGFKVAEFSNAELPLHDKSYTEVNDVIVGFEDVTRDILDQLVGGPGSESLQVISIVGMPGLGKTTLAKTLYNHPLVNYTFAKLSWCVVSQTYKRRDMLANILIHINSDLGKDRILNMEEIRIVEHIHKTLMGRKYLILLDDIWDSNVLDELLRCFPDNRNGSRILLTSRNKDVVPPNSIIHELSFLSDEQCWELLQKKVFGSRGCVPQLQGIGKRIAARCCGLPLTVVVIAGVISTVDEEERSWEEVGRSLASYIDGEENSVMQILELSYKHLPDHLKPCFLHFGEYEEDEEISVGELKRLWVAEGFIRKEKGKSAEIIAGEYLKELIDKSLIMISKRRADGRGAKGCVVHDLLRDLCLKISKEESFLKYLNSDYDVVYEKGHRIRASGDSTTLSYGQHVRSFVGSRLSSSFYVRDMRLLRVLHFKIFISFEGKFMFGTEYLINLRFLVIDMLPTWIDRLINLEYLRVGKVMCIPPAIVKMKKLRYLRANNAVYGEDWNNSHETNNLEYLSRVYIYNLEDEELLKCSPHLRKLECLYRLGIKKGGYPHFDLCSLTQLDSLFLDGHLSKGDFGFPSNIRKLTLEESHLPWEKMSIIGRLEFLEVLKLYSNAFVGERWDTRDGEFQKLKFLLLCSFTSLSAWNVASCEHFPELQQLILDYCMNLEEIPSEIGEITTLELIELKWPYRVSMLESAEGIIKEQRDMGNEGLRLVIRNA